MTNKFLDGPAPPHEVSHCSLGLSTNEPDLPPFQQHRHSRIRWSWILVHMESPHSTSTDGQQTEVQQQPLLHRRMGPEVTDTAARSSSPVRRNPQPGRPARSADPQQRLVLLLPKWNQPLMNLLQCLYHRFTFSLLEYWCWHSVSRAPGRSELPVSSGQTQQPDFPSLVDPWNPLPASPAAPPQRHQPSAAARQFSSTFDSSFYLKYIQN